jgi:Flp pilus assembly protein TadG
MKAWRGRRSALRGGRGGEGVGSSSLGARLRDERGSSLVIVAAGIVVFLGAAAVSVDLGMLFVAHSQAQRAADAAALAAAGILSNQPDDTAAARAEGIAYAAKNDILGTPAAVQGSDVTFPGYPTILKARVWVYRTAARGDPVNTIFARVLGINTADIAVKAAAQVYPAGGAKCVLPIMIPDKFGDTNGDGVWEPGEPYTAPGYTNDDYGLAITLRAFVNPGPANPSWYYPFRQPGMQGGADYRDGIEGKHCGGADSPDYETNTWVDTEPGAMIGPTMQGFTALINSDPGISWETGPGTPAKGCPSRDQGQSCSYDTPRIRALPLFDPTTTPDPGVKPLEIKNFAALFIDGVSGNTILGHFLYLTAMHPIDSGNLEGLPHVVVLVE